MSIEKAHKVGIYRVVINLATLFFVVHSTKISCFYEYFVIATNIDSYFKYYILLHYMIVIWLALYIDFIYKLA